MVNYKFVALSNTTIGVLMASINGTIIRDCLQQLDDNEALSLLENMEKLRSTVAKRKKALSTHDL